MIISVHSRGQVAPEQVVGLYGYFRGSTAVCSTLKCIAFWQILFAYDLPTVFLPNWKYRLSVGNQLLTQTHIIF